MQYLLVRPKYVTRYAASEVEANNLAGIMTGLGMQNLTIRQSFCGTIWRVRACGPPQLIRQVFTLVITG